MYNFLLADCMARIHVAGTKKISSVIVSRNMIVLYLLNLLSKEGYIDGFRINNFNIIVFLKFDAVKRIFLLKNLKLVSTPGRRRYWNLKKLSCCYSYANFSGSYIISSNKGLVTSSDALLRLRVGGEVLLKISI
jgi:ribosomal protein S8